VILSLDLRCFFSLPPSRDTPPYGAVARGSSLFLAMFPSLEPLLSPLQSKASVGHLSFPFFPLFLSPRGEEPRFRSRSLGLPIILSLRFFFSLRGFCFKTFPLKRRLSFPTGVLHPPLKISTPSYSSVGCDCLVPFPFLLRGHLLSGSGD